MKTIQTMEAIARRVGVSRPVVSAVLNATRGSVRVSAPTREKILAVASSCGYRPNALARAMVTGQTRVIGYLSPGEKEEFASQVLTGAGAEAANRDYFLKYLPYKDPEECLRNIHACQEYRVAGVIARSMKEPLVNILHQKLGVRGVPMALVDESLPHAWGIRVMSDDEDGMRQAVQHLVKLGHRRIAHLTLERHRLFVRRRLKGYRQAMRAQRLPITADFVLHVKGYDEIEAVLRLALGKPKRPTAFLCVEDHLAMLVLRTAHRLGLRVPEDLSVVGFANMTMAKFSDPPLTSIEQPFEDMGQTAIRLLIDDIERKQRQTLRRPMEAVLGVKLVVRDSSGPAPAEN